MINAEWEHPDEVRKYNSFQRVISRLVEREECDEIDWVQYTEDIAKLSFHTFPVTHKTPLDMLADPFFDPVRRHGKVRRRRNTFTLQYQNPPRRFNIA